MTYIVILMSFQTVSSIKTIYNAVKYSKNILYEP